MTNLEQFQPKTSQTVDAIFAAWEKKSDFHRGYLGASQIGEPCARKLWYSFRWCGQEVFSGRMRRLFARGDVEESRMVADLQNIGCEVCILDPETGRQFKVSDCGGHFQGHLDGCALGIPEASKTWHVLEFKTHNTKSFQRLKRDGVLITKPMHFAQVQVEMHLTGMDRALYLACNKDDDDLYSERIKYDKEYAAGMMERARRVITSLRPPEKTGDCPSHENCKYCHFCNLCHGNPVGTAVPCTATCRSCVLAEPRFDGNARWVCNLKEKALSVQDQEVACSWHLFAAGIVTFGEVIEVKRNSDNSVYAEYMNAKDNSVWRNGPDREDGQFSSLELTRMPYSTIAEGNGFNIIKRIKEMFAGEVMA